MCFMVIGTLQIGFIHNCVFRIVKVFSVLRGGGILIIAVFFSLIQLLTIFSNKGHDLGLEL